MRDITGLGRSIAVLCVLLALTGCAGVSSSGASSSAATGGDSSATPGADGPVTTPEDAVAAVVAAHPEFEGIGPFDPDLIGGCCWYTAAPRDGGYEVVFRIGWGDCPAGCISEHQWTFLVGVDGGVELAGEGGDPIPPGGIPRN
jgi:hypothetical protein